MKNRGLVFLRRTVRACKNFINSASFLCCVKCNIRLLSAMSLVVAVLIVGTFLFHALEGWSFVDSFYFAGITVTTIGYGDLHPTHDLSKIVAVVFSLAGVGIMLFCLTTIAQLYFERRQEAFLRRIERAEQRVFSRGKSRGGIGSGVRARAK